MKLNLLPTYVSRGKRTAVAVVLSVVIALAGIGAAAVMMTSSQRDLKEAKDRVALLDPQAAEVSNRAKQAETIIQQAALYNLNIGLAEAMQKHNDVYPQLYEEVKRYIPGFFRITSLTATPNGAETCTVTMNGFVESYRRWVDLMFAMLRIPGARNVSRSGYTLRSKYVPGINAQDTVGRSIFQGQPRLPDDPVDRIDVLIAQARGSGQDPIVGGFGASPNAAGAVTRGAMPTWTPVTVAVVLPKNLLTPNPRDTLATAAAVAQQAASASAPAPATTPPAGGAPNPGGAR